MHSLIYYEIIIYFVDAGFMIEIPLKIIIKEIKNVYSPWTLIWNYDGFLSETLIHFDPQALKNNRHSPF